MNKSPYFDLQQAIVYNLLSDIRQNDTQTIGKLTDELGLTPSVFDYPHYRVAFTAIQEQYIAHVARDVPFAATSMLARIEETYRTNGHADNANELMAGWRSRLSQNPRGVDVVGAARTLRNEMLRSKFNRFVESLPEQVRQATEPAEVIHNIAYEILGMVDNTSAPSIRQALYSAIESKPISCGIEWLDQNIFYNRYAGYGGFAPTMLITWASPSENGKTSAATTFAALWIARAFPCLILSAEESRENLSVRLLSACTGLSGPDVVRTLERLRARDAQEEITLSESDHKVDQTIELIQSYAPIYEINGTSSQINRIVRRHRVQFGAETPMLVLIDHLSAMDTGSGNWSRSLEQVTKEVKRITTEMRTTTIVFAQATGDMELEFREKNYTTKVDVRGSKGVRQWSDQGVGACRHNGVPLPGHSPSDFYAATVVQRLKNRFKDESQKSLPWGVFKFNPVTSTITDTLITDDWHAQMEVGG